jgi:DNA-binding NarL/FixJ family response regulator
MPTIRLLLADDHPSLRAGIRARLDMEENIQVVGEAGTGLKVIELVSALRPHVLLLDLQLPELSGVEVVRRLSAADDPVRILILSAYHNASYVAALRDFGVAGYLTKQEPLDTIVQAVKGIARGETGWLSRDVAAVLMKQPASDSTEPADLLSEREREVLQLIAEGLTNHQIGDRLFISESTVKKHVSSLYQKLELNTRTAAAAWAWEHGLSNPSAS